MVGASFAGISRDTIINVTAALVVGIPAIAATVWAGRTRRSRVGWDVIDTVELVPDTSQTLGVQVTLGGVTLSDPWLCSLALENLGRRDLSDSSFNGSRPLRFEVGAPVIQVLSDAGLKVTTNGSDISVGPSLLKARRRYRVRLLLDGPPAFAVAAEELVDADLVRQNWKTPVRTVTHRDIYFVAMLYSLLVFAALSGTTRYALPGVIGLVLVTTVLEYDRRQIRKASRPET